MGLGHKYILYLRHKSMFYAENKTQKEYNRNKLKQNKIKQNQTKQQNKATHNNFVLNK